MRRTDVDSQFKVVYALPSANIEGAIRTFPQWRNVGYSVLVLVERARERDYLKIADTVVGSERYAGYPWAIQHLIRTGSLDDADIIVTGGDDMFPDPRDSQEIAREFFRQFPDGFGVMQPTGDGHGCEEICGSPWMGQPFVRAMNGGRGPFWPEYHHYYCDRELKIVAEKLGILWQRPDLVQRHSHWSWTTGTRPLHMAQHRKFHGQDEALFKYRSSHDFPGHLPITVP